MLLIVQSVYFLWCWCGVWCGLQPRRRVSRFTPCLRLRLSCCSACGLALVFASFGGFILPFAFTIAVCAVIYTRARFLIYARTRGSRVLWLPRWGGVSLPRPILKRVHSKTQVIQAAGAELGGAGRLAGAEKDP